jgi:hypothetical protein
MTWEESIPQGLKPHFLVFRDGTAEAMPLTKLPSIREPFRFKNLFDSRTFSIRKSILARDKTAR